MIFTRHKLGLHKMTTISRIQNDKLKLRNNLNDLLSSIREMNNKSVTKANKEYQRQHPQGVWLPDDVWGVIVEFMLGTDKKFKPPYERWRPSLRMRQFFPGEVYHGVCNSAPVQMLVLKREKYSQQHAGHRIHYILLKNPINSVWEIGLSATTGRIRTGWVKQYEPENEWYAKIPAHYDTLPETIKNTRYNIEFKAQNMLCAWNDTKSGMIRLTSRQSTTQAETQRRAWLMNKAGHYKNNKRQIRMYLRINGSVKFGFVGDKKLMDKRWSRCKHYKYRYIKFCPELIDLQRRVRNDTYMYRSDFQPSSVLF